MTFRSIGPVVAGTFIWLAGINQTVWGQLQEATAQAKNESQRLVVRNQEILNDPTALNQFRQNLIGQLTQVINLLPAVPTRFGGGPDEDFGPMCETDRRCLPCWRRFFHRRLACRNDCPEVTTGGAVPQTIRRRIREELEGIRDSLQNAQLIQPELRGQLAELNLQALGLLALIQRLNLQ